MQTFRFIAVVGLREYPLRNRCVGHRSDAEKFANSTAYRNKDNTITLLLEYTEMVVAAGKLDSIHIVPEVR
jgi:hypothetical protein